MSVKAVNAGISVYRDFVESVKRRPLKEGVERLVTVANDNVKRTLGRNSEFIYLETKTASGVESAIVKSIRDKTILSGTKYPDGSWYVTGYNNYRPFRTDGAFVVTKKDGSKTLVGYGVNGKIEPAAIKKFHMATLDSLGDPSKEVDLRGVFESRPKSRLGKFFSDINYKIGRFFKRFSKLNREMREYAASVDRNA